MRYISTRGKAPELGFEDVLLSGLANDGGLYIPKEWPKLDFNSLPTTSYSEQAAYVIYPFVSEFLNYEELQNITDKAYSQFPNKEAIGLKEVSSLAFSEVSWCSAACFSSASSWFGGMCRRRR